MKTQCLAGCGRPAHNATLCNACTERLEKDLGDLPGLATDLEIAETRQAVMGQRHGARGTERPLPWDDRARKARITAACQLVQVVARVGPQPTPRINGGPVCEHAAGGCDHDSCRARREMTSGWPRADIAAMGRWLLTHLRELRQRDDADVIADEVRRVLRGVRWVIDRPGDHWYAGPCRAEYSTEPALAVHDCACICHIGGAFRPACDVPGGCGLTHDQNVDLPDACCVVDLYAKHDATVIVCSNCGTEHDAGERQAWLLAVAEDTLAHAELIGRAAPNLGVEITPAAIRGYAARGRLAVKSVDRQGRPMYRVGDVISLAQEAMTRRAERSSRRSA